MSQQLVDFLRYVRSGDAQHGDVYVEQLSASVNRIKIDRDMGARFMLLEEMMKDERKAGRAEGRVEVILSLLAAKGFTSPELNEKISTITDPSTLDSLVPAILNAATPEDLFTMLK